jgi:serine/threonine protein kinase
LDDYLRAKVGDFGLASKVQRNEQAPQVMNTLETKFNGVGSLIYIAPECFVKEIYTRYADVYAFGIILHNIFVTQDEEKTFDPIKPDTFLHKLLKDNITPILPSPEKSKLSTEVREVIFPLMKRCWERNWLERPKFVSFVKELKELRLRLGRKKVVTTL